MPLDPSISTQIQIPQVNAAGGLDTVSRFAQIQNSLNQAKLFTQTFAARTRAGQLLAASDPNDPESGMRALMGDPQTAAFAPEIINTMRTAESTLLDLQGKQQSQTQSAFQSFLKSLPAAYNNPEMLPGLVKANLAQLPLGARVLPQVREAYGDILTSLMGNLPQGDASKGEFQKRLLGLMMAGGTTPEMLTKFVGEPFRQEIGGNLIGGVQQPAIAGGGLSIASNVPMTLAPQLAKPGEGEIPVGGAYGTGMPPQGNVTIGTPSMSIPSPSGAPSSGPLAAGGGGSMNMPSPSQGGASPSVVAPRNAGDGTPLFQGDMTSPYIGTGIGGARILSPEQRGEASELSKEFNTSGVKAYNNAKTSQASLQEMNANLDRVIANGGAGILTPGGAFPELRTNLAKSVNTIAQMFGQEPPIDPSKMAGIEDIIKNTKRMGISTLTQMLGNQREAALTIQSITKAVPSIDNSILGMKFISSMLGAQAQWQIDQHEFQRQWGNQNQGNLTGSVEAFNQIHAPEKYIDSALAQYGMTRQGFASPEAVRNAVQSGWITRQQGLDQLHSQWPGGPPNQGSSMPPASGTTDQLQ